MKSASLRGYRSPCASFLPMATHRWVLYLQTNHDETLIYRGRVLLGIGLKCAGYGPQGIRWYWKALE